MTSQFKSTYFQSTSRVILPEPAKNLSDQDKIISARLVAGIYANFAGAGYLLAEQDVEKLKLVAPEELQKFYNVYMSAIKDQLGDNFKNARIFYPGFPQQVVDSEGLERLVDQLIHYISGGEITPALRDDKYAHTMATDLRSIQTRPLLCETMDQVSQCIDNTYKSVRPWSESQYLMIQEALKCPEFKTPKEPLYSHENRALYAYLQYQMNNKIRGRKIAEMCPQPTDILRLAAVLSQPENSEHSVLAKAAHLDIDKSVAVKNRFDLKNTSTRNLILFALNDAVSKAPNIDAALLDMWKKTNLIHWKALFGEIHASNKKNEEKAPYTYKVANCVYHDLAPKRDATEIEKYIEEKNVNQLVQLLLKKPGEFVRRFDKLLRLAEETDRVDLVCQALVDASVKAGIATVLSLMSIVDARGKDEYERHVKFVKDGSTVIKALPAKKLRKALDPETHNAMKQACRQILAPENLTKRFAGKPELGLIYASPELDNYQISLNTREQSAGMLPYGPGTQVKLDNTQDIVRFFIAWTNTDRRRVDLDLTARVVFEDPKTHEEREELIGWNGKWSQSDMRWNGDEMFKTLTAFSGDITDGGSSNGPGAIEALGINKQVAREMHVKKIIMECSSYNEIPFNEIPHAYMGYMERTPGQQQPVFDIATVSNKIKMNTTAIREIFGVMDIENDRFLVVDMPAEGNIASLGTKTTDAIIKYVEEHKTLSIYDLARCNAIANDGMTDDLAKAQTIVTVPAELEKMRQEHPEIDFSAKQIVLASDASAINGMLLANGDPAKIPVRNKVLDKTEHTRKHRSQDDLTI